MKILNIFSLLIILSLKMCYKRGLRLSLKIILGC